MMGTVRMVGFVFHLCRFEVFDLLILVKSGERCSVAQSHDELVGQAVHGLNVETLTHCII